MFFVVPCSRLLLDMLCHHTFSLLCPRSRERTSPENQQSNPWLPTKTKVPVEVMERMTKLKLQKALLKSLGRSIYSLLHLPTKSKHKVFVPNKQTNSSPTTKQPNKTKKTSTTLSPYILLTLFAMLFIIYIYPSSSGATPLPLESSGGSLRLHCTVASGECLLGGVRCETLMSIPCEEKKKVHKTLGITYQDLNASWKRSLFCYWVGKQSVNQTQLQKPRWWFQIFFLFSPRKLGKMNPFWLICFKGVETTNQKPTAWGKNGGSWEDFFLGDWKNDHQGLEVEVGKFGKTGISFGAHLQGVEWLSDSLWFCTCLLLCFVSFIGWLSSLNVGALEIGARKFAAKDFFPGFAEGELSMEKMRYCWWKKSGTTWDLLSTGAGFFPSTVLPEKCDASCALVWFIAFLMFFSTQLLFQMIDVRGI